MLRSLIVAMSENHTIGRDGDLPWRLSSDLKRFKRLTMGHSIVMGRKTWESIGRPLPGRTMIVVTRRVDYTADDVVVVPNLETAFEVAMDDEEVFVIGGGDIYRQAIDLVDRLYLTMVHAKVEGDTSFPELDHNRWRLIESSRHPADAKNDYDHSFLIYQRVEYA